MIGLYIHIPFCDAKCGYCDFYSMPGSQNDFDDYELAIIRAVENSPLESVDTVYFGGGTPSLWGAERLCKTLDFASRHFKISRGGEITLEANPGSVDFQMLRQLHLGGFTRISFGVQSTFDDTLRMLGRRHSGEDAISALHLARKAGFEHVSADIMLAVPGQTAARAGADIDRVAGSGADHISLYLLKHEPATPFSNISPMPDDDAADLYLAAGERCEIRGLHQYEISNFAASLPSQSRHNLKYWRCRETLGIGASAHSFYKGERFYFPADIKAFCSCSNFWSNTVSCGPGGSQYERIMLGMRLSEGILPLDYPDYMAHIEKRGDYYVKLGLVSRSAADRRISLTPAGCLVSNRIIADFLSP
jgi:oxygen-independent coproporphyrinogen-3 oxidase